MKKIFKNLLVPATGLVILPISSCNTVKPQEETTTLEIVSDIEDMIVTKDGTTLSDPIKTKCIGPDKQERLIDLKFKLKLEGSETLPKWISMSDKNEIQISGGKEIGTYSFTLSAYNDELKLYSNTKTFKVYVYDERYIVPDKLDIDVIDDQYYTFAKSSTIPITITPSKEGVEEKYLLNACKCEVKEISGPKLLDKSEQPLFYCNDDTANHQLIISADTDESYIGDYNITISAVLVEDPTIKAEKTITLHIANVLRQYDSVNKCQLKRFDWEDGWTIESIEGTPNVIRIKDVKIQHRSITKIGINFCGASKITALGQVILPECITEICDSAFANQGTLCSIEMPGVKKIGNSAFEDDSMLELRAGSKTPSFKTVGNFAFQGCKLWKLGYLPEATWIGDFAFEGASFNSFTFGENCGYVGKNCFKNCTEMSNFEIHTIEPPKTGGAIFSGCSKLSIVHVPTESLEKYRTNSYWKSEGKTFEGI